MRNMKKKICIVLAVMIITLSACSVSDPRRRLSHQLGIDLMKDDITLLREVDTTGWFGDGYILSELDCKDSAVLNEIINNENWTVLPLSENLRHFFYEGYFSSDELLIPVIEEGYYYFYDRHDQAKDPYDDSDIYDRPSLNFTFAVYDTKEERLYVFEFNT